jgi:HK97 family phage portal protein
VWNAVELISGTIAALPLNLMQGSGETKRIAEDYKLHRVMHSRWNPYMTAKRGRECLSAHVLTWGNGYAEIVRNTYGQVVELWPITPSRVTPKMADGSLVYEIRMDIGAPVTLPREKVLHILGPSYDGFIGYSRIAMARKSIGLGMALETFGALYFGQGTHPGIVVGHPGKLSDTANAHLMASLTEGYSGLGKTHKLLLLEEGMKLEKLGIPPEDSQFLESRQFHVTEIARWFNVPPHKIKDLTRSSFNNIESEQRSFYTDTLLPSLVDLEQSYDMQLLKDSERDLSGRGRLYFKHNADGKLRAGTAARATFYKELWYIGAINNNEIRSLEDLPPRLGGEIYFVPANMNPLGKDGKPILPEPPAPKALPEKTMPNEDDMPPGRMKK